jgi:hypothetical protein
MFTHAGPFVRAGEREESQMVFRLFRWKTLRRVVLVACLAMVLAACGDGGGSGGSNNPAADNANWDTLVWDRNQWQ